MTAYRDIPSDIVCKSFSMKSVLHRAMLVADVGSNILITGESGTGKGVVSRFIHDRSKQKEKPFIKIDCGSIPETLFESELFGYERGAFTGASKNGKIGLMELANGGTLFLDEIGELPLNCQAKLLRAIQEKEFLRIGGSQVVHVDVRIIAATNRDLKKMVEERQFREDLYYRINVVSIQIPPLRERQEDIPELIQKFSESLCSKYGISRKFTVDAVAVLTEHRWKGNIRELENFVEMMLVTTEKPSIGLEDLPVAVQEQWPMEKWRQSKNGTLNERLDFCEKTILNDLLAQGMTPIEMAHELQVDVTTIRRKLSRHTLRARKNAEMH